MDPNQNQNPQPINNDTPMSPVTESPVNAEPAQPMPPAADQPPTPVVGGADMAGAPVTSPAPVASSKSRKLLLVALIALVVLAGSSAAYYFGYYTNSSVILSQSLGNTGKGYAKLVDYLSRQNKLNYKGTVGSGHYTFKSGGNSTDGSLNYKSDGANSDLTFDIGLGVSRVSAEILTIKSSGANPDVYIKASGIKGYGALTGSQQIDNTVNQLDGKWVVIDHSLLDNITNKAQVKASNMPTSAEVLDEVQAFGHVNQQYVFTTNQSKSITVVQKKYGMEKVDGHKTYHYKMGFNKANLKQYITAQRDALNGSKLDSWIKANNYQAQVNNSYNQLEKAADKIKSSDSFDLWADMNSRLVYKIRVSDTSNPAANYADIGLNYKDGSSSYPFFLNFHSKDSSSTSTAAVTATLDTKANSLALNLNFSSGSSNFSANLSFKPSDQPVNLTAPTGAESLMQVLDQLGVGALFNAYLQSAGSSSTSTANPTSVNSLFQ